MHETASAAAPKSLVVNGQRANEKIKREKIEIKVVLHVHAVRMVFHIIRSYNFIFILAFTFCHRCVQYGSRPIIHVQKKIVLV